MRVILRGASSQKVPLVTARAICESPHPCEFETAASNRQRVISRLPERRHNPLRLTHGNPCHIPSSQTIARSFTTVSLRTDEESFPRG